MKSLIFMLAFSLVLPAMASKDFACPSQLVISVDLDLEKDSNSFKTRYGEIIRDELYDLTKTLLSERGCDTDNLDATLSPADIKASKTYLHLKYSYRPSHIWRSYCYFSVNLSRVDRHKKIHQIIRKSHEKSSLGLLQHEKSCKDKNLLFLRSIL